MELPYFITWSKQKAPTTLELSKNSPHAFHIVEGSTYRPHLKKIVDLSSMSYQASFGLRNKMITEAIKKQMSLFSIALPKHTFDLKKEVSLRLIEKAKRYSPQTGKLSKDYKCFYTLSGSEGIENALKMARQLTGKNIILARKKSYHGATMGALSVTGDWRNDEHLLPRQWTVRIPGPEEDPKGEGIERIILKHGSNKIAAFCLETITGGNGVYIPHPLYYKKIQSLANKYKIKIIMDEVVCAVYRTGPFFGIDHYPFLKPDFIVCAKAISGGFFPIGCVLVCNKLSKRYDDKILSCGLTHYAHPLGLSAIKATLDLTEQRSFQKHADEILMILTEFARDLSFRGFKVRHIGHLMAIEIQDKLTIESLIENGIYASIIRENLILAPHLNTPIRLLKSSLKTLNKLLSE